MVAYAYFGKIIHGAFYTDKRSWHVKKRYKRWPIVVGVLELITGFSVSLDSMTFASY
jgi:hypothetical protein